MTFEELGFEGEILRALADLGFQQPTPIQEQAIPMLKSGDIDLVGLAQTGTGKTAAFALPMLSLIDGGKRHTQALIIAPTRELCMQITSDVEKFAKYMPLIKVVAVYGGTRISGQIRDLRQGTSELL